MKKLLSSTILASAAFAAQAQEGFLGTKQSAFGGATVPTGSGSGGAMPLIQMVLALAVVLALLKFALPKLLTKFGHRLTTNATSELNIQESASFPGGQLYIVRARAKTLLLGVGTSGISCLADLTEAETPTPTFQDMVEKAVIEIPEPVEIPEPENDVEAALRRLQRLTG